MERSAICAGSEGLYVTGGSNGVLKFRVMMVALLQRVPVSMMVPLAARVCRAYRLFTGRLMLLSWRVNSIACATG